MNFVEILIRGSPIERERKGEKSIQWPMHDSDNCCLFKVLFVTVTSTFHSEPFSIYISTEKLPQLVPQSVRDEHMV